MQFICYPKCTTCQKGVRTVFWTVLESKFGKRHIWIRILFRVFFEMLMLLIQIHVMNEI